MLLGLTASEVDEMTLRDIDNLLEHYQLERDNVARAAWYNGLFVRMAFHGDAYPDSPHDWLPSVMAEEAEKRVEYHKTWTVKDVWKELEDT